MRLILNTYLNLFSLRKRQQKTIHNNFFCIFAHTEDCFIPQEGLFLRTRKIVSSHKKDYSFEHGRLFLPARRIIPSHTRKILSSHIQTKKRIDQKRRTMREGNNIFFSLFAVLLSSLLMTGCNSNTIVQPSKRAVYLWTTQINMDSTKLQFLKSHDISRMYVRFFDVVLDEQGNATPNATARFVTPLPKNMDIVPTVFLMPECLRGDRQQLAKQIVDRVMQMCETNDVTGVKEMQIDCDWTSSTRQAYHRFMATMLELCHARGINLSSTIRLHQLAQTPPPADRGVLMMYNTGNVADINCHKPILDMHDAAPYLKHLKSYKLPLSTAYPVFAWRVLFRGRQFVGIIHSDDEYPLLPTDSICTRQPSMADITDAIKAVEQRRADANNEIILFDLNNNNLKTFNTYNYEEIYNRGLSAHNSSNM